MNRNGELETANRKRRTKGRTKPRTQQRAETACWKNRTERAM